MLHWFICFWGNLAGALLVTLVIFGGMYYLNASLPLLHTKGIFPVGGVFDADPYRAETIAYATKKQITPMWHQIFLRGIGCNWLVCLACFLGMQGRNLTDKIMGIWWPIFAFVGLGLDHVVANMYVAPSPQPTQRGATANILGLPGSSSQSASGSPHQN